MKYLQLHEIADREEEHVGKDQLKSLFRSPADSHVEEMCFCQTSDRNEISTALAEA